MSADMLHCLLDLGLLPWRLQWAWRALWCQSCRLAHAELDVIAFTVCRSYISPSSLVSSSAPFLVSASVQQSGLRHIRHRAVVERARNIASISVSVSDCVNVSERVQINFLLDTFGYFADETCPAVDCAGYRGIDAIKFFKRYFYSCHVTIFTFLTFF